MQRAIEKYRNGEITKEEYDQWRYNYPKYDTYSRRAKVMYSMYHYADGHIGGLLHQHISILL